MDYTRFVNDLSARRQPSAIREMRVVAKEGGPGLIPMYVGAPNPETFPFR